MSQKFGGISLPRNGLRRTSIPIGRLADGTAINLPVAAIHGRHEGPTVYLQAGLHGNEVTGIEALRRIVGQIDPAEVRGLIVTVPLANPAAFITKQRGFSLEERGPFDLNRTFPGSASGLFSERLADLLFDGFLLHADFTIDFHSALAGCNIHPFVYIDPGDDANGTLADRELIARAIGTDLAYRKARGSRLGTSVMTGSLATQAEAAGKVMTSFEMGESGRVSFEHMERAVNGVLNALRVIGALDGSSVVSDSQREFSTIHLVHGEQPGLIHPLVNLGGDVTAGDALVEISDPVTGTVNTVVAPVNGTVLRLMVQSPVMPGAEIAWIVN